MNYSLKKLSSNDSETINKVCEILKDTYPEKISQYFIYNDRSFKAFLTANLNRTDQFIYYLSDTEENLIGFAQFKVVSRTLFLLNLIIDPKHQNNQYGSKLLAQSIQLVVASLPQIKVFELHSFVSNTVLEWYLRLGMKVLSFTYWYDLKGIEKPKGKKQSTSNLFQYKTDQFGFTQLFLNSYPAGYLLNGKKLIVKGSLDLHELKKIPLEYNGQRIEAGCLISDKVIDLPIIDKCFLLSVPLPDLQFKNGHTHPVAINT
jgi:ribosomal protein S18 acetylase RimI-like enzyme